MNSTPGSAAREMPIIHRIFRRQFPEVRELVQEVPSGRATRIGAVADHLGFLLDGLHMHHTTEDDLIWPKLLDRAGLDAPLVTRMEEQHEQIDASVAEVRAAVSAWRPGPTPSTSSALADRIGEFLVVLEGHLDEEEEVVVPLMTGTSRTPSGRRSGSVASRSSLLPSGGSPPASSSRSRRPRRQR